MVVINSVVLNEEWKTIKGYEGLYEVSNMGRVHSLVGWNGHRYVKREKMLSPYVQKVSGNYKRLIVKLTKDKKKKDFKVHRLVALTFLPPIDGKLDVNHIDGDTFNNKVCNLEWCTQKENVNHAIRIGLREIIDIPDEQLIDMYVTQRMSLRDIAENFGVAATTISERLDGLEVEKRTFSEAKMEHGLTKEFILKELKSKTQTQLAKEVGCSQSLISHYLKRIREEGKIYKTN